MVALAARDVSWDWTGLPMHKLRQRPLASYIGKPVSTLTASPSSPLVCRCQALLRSLLLVSVVNACATRLSTHIAARKTTT